MGIKDYSQELYKTKSSIPVAPDDVNEEVDDYEDVDTADYDDYEDYEDDYEDDYEEEE